MRRFVLVFSMLVLSLPLTAQTQTEIQFVRYKNFLIPVALPPEIESPSLTATKDDANAVFLVWSQPIGATTYELWRLDPEWALIYKGSDLTYTDVYAPSGVVTYKIKPCNSVGCSFSNAQATVTIPDINTGGGWVFDDDPIAPENPDLDGDGIHNDSDFCPFTPANQAVNNYGCAVSETGGSSGGSGIGFQCVDPNTGQASDDVNCPSDQQDADFDGVPNVADAYPLQANGTGFCPGI